ncbi:MAG: DUF4097 family beta strand repeat-containing protein [Candidatus Hodarchaeota archaeon]
MKKKLLIFEILISSLFFNGIIILGITYFITYGEYRESFTFYYDSDAPNPVEKLRLYSDIVKFDVKYNMTPVDYYTKVEVHFDMHGPCIKGKSYLNYFQPILWQNISNSILFSLESFPSTEHDALNLFGKKNNAIIVTLRTDVMYDINIASYEGDITMSVPNNVIVNQINFNTFSGNLSLITNKAIFNEGLTLQAATGCINLNFSDSRMGNFIKLITFTGDIDLYSYNMEYMEKCDWDLFSTSGDILVDIIQRKEIRGKISGTIETEEGNVYMNYEDNLKNVGARFNGDFFF